MFIALLARAFPEFNAFIFIGLQFYPALFLQEFFSISGAVPVEVADGVGVVEVKGGRKDGRKSVRKIANKFVREDGSEGFGEGYQVVAFVVGDCWDGVD